MNSEKSWVYLHTEGSIHFKRYYPEPSDFTRRIWVIDPTDRLTGWRFILEALSFYPDNLNNFGGNAIRRMIENSNFDLEDLIQYLIHERDITEDRRAGIEVYLKTFSIDRKNPEVYGVDYDEWMDWLGSTPGGEDPDLETMPRPVETQTTT